MASRVRRTVVRIESIHIRMDSREDHLQHFCPWPARAQRHHLKEASHLIARNGKVS